MTLFKKPSSIREDADDFNHSERHKCITLIYHNFHKVYFITSKKNVLNKT